jgi:hypothetical protein
MKQILTNSKIMIFQWKVKRRENLNRLLNSSVHLIILIRKIKEWILKVEMMASRIMNNKKKWNRIDLQVLLLNKSMIRILKLMNHLKQNKEVSYKGCFLALFFQNIKI